MSACAIAALLALVLLALALRWLRDARRPPSTRSHPAKPTRPSSGAAHHPDFIPAARFAGCKPKYVFTARDDRLGYHKDQPHFLEDINMCARPTG